MAAINTWPGQGWECVRELGEGAFGKVYEIRREEFGTEYRAALKVISVPRNVSDLRSAYSDGMDEKSAAEYFRGLVSDIVAECALMSQFKGYSNVVSYEDHMVIPHENEVGWDILIRMELLTPLQDYLQIQTVTEQDVIRLGCDICRALELCHKNDIMHRDIKPENIFVNNNGDFKLGDFGIARRMEKTASGLSSKGTFTYMAPEVYRGDNYGMTVDIYSLAMVLYRYLNNGRIPFLTDGQLYYSDKETAQRRRLSGEAIPAPMHGSRRLQQAVLKGLSYFPQERYRTPEEFRKALEACLERAVPEEKTELLTGSSPSWEDTMSLSQPTERLETVVALPKEQEPSRPAHKLPVWIVPLLLGVMIVLLGVLILRPGEQLPPEAEREELEEQSTDEPIPENQAETVEPIGVNYAEGIFCDRNTFEITSDTGLAVFRDIVNGQNEKLVEGWSDTVAPNGLNDISAILMADIDLTKYCSARDGGWEPIGKQEIGFNGTFDGNGREISGFYGNYQSYRDAFGAAEEEISGGVGLFALNRGTIKNLAVSGEISTAIERAGGICGINRGTIESCVNCVIIDSTAQYLGGIAGVNESGSHSARIRYCSNFGDLTTTQAEAKIGGICGGNWNGAIVESCYNLGLIQSDGSKYVGPIAGKYDGDSVVSCCAYDYCNASRYSWELPKDDTICYASWEEFAYEDGRVYDTLRESAGAPWRFGGNYPQLKNCQVDYEWGR